MSTFFKLNKRYFVYAMLFLFLGIYSVDRITMALAGSTIAKEMHLGPVALGYLFSSFLWLYWFCLLPAGFMTDRLGPLRMCSIAAGFWSLFQMLGGAAVSALTLLLTRLGNGAFESAANPCAHATIREWAPRRERGLATAIWFSGAHAFPAVASPVVAWIIAVYGWRMSFIATGLMGLVWVAVWAAFYRPPEKAHWLAAEEREMILRERDVAASLNAPGVGYRGLLGTPTMWGLALSQGCINYVSYFYLAWLPGFLQADYGLTVLQTGTYTAIPFFLSAVACLILSWICDRLLSAQDLREGKRRYAVAWANLASAVVLFVPYAGSITVAMVLLTISLAANTFAQTMNFAFANDRLRTSGDVGRTFAFFTLGGITFGAIGPIITGYLVQATGSFNIALVLCGGFAIAAVIISLLMTKRVLGGRRGETVVLLEAT